MVLQPKRKGEDVKIKNIFISHIHDDDNQVPNVKGAIENHGCEVRNGSIDSSKENDANAENYIKYDILAPRIKWAGALVVYITPDTHESDWVNWEIEFAGKDGIPIVGIWGDGCEGSELPDAFHDYGGALLPIDSQHLLDAIEGNYTNWNTPKGEDIPMRTMPRYGC